MDNDHDNLLKYRDFCNLCAELMMNGAPSLGDTSYLASSNKSKASSDFSNIIKQLKAKQPVNRGRGGPNFPKRVTSAGPSQNFENSKSIQ